VTRWNRRQINTLSDLNENRRRNLDRRNGIIETNTENESLSIPEELTPPTSIDIDYGVLSQYFIGNTRGVRSNCIYAMDEELKPKYIKPYNYIPNKFNMHKLYSDETQLYMGVELEIDNGGETENNAKFIQEYLGEDNCYIMHDGSLSNGLEIVTHPCSLNYHKQLPYKDLFNKLTKKNYKSHDTKTCGYHIHINRNFFNENPTIQDLCITKVLYLLEKHWDNIKKIARRDSCGYSRRFNMKEDESLFELLLKAKGGDMYGNKKYQMVNLQHKDTVEFRLFKGTLKYETFIATLEFISNLVHICKTQPLEEIQMIKFEDIININEVEYLKEYIKERNIKL
jgi:hypothetical protein